MKNKIQESILDLENFYKYAQVIVDVKNLGLKTFSYLIPEHLKSSIKIGQAVLVPFGSFHAITAFVVSFSNYLSDDIKPKYITEILDEVPIFDLNYLKLLEWVSEYYISDFHTVLQNALPIKFFKHIKRVVYLDKNNQNSIIDNLDDKELSVYKAITDKPISVIYLKKKFKITYSDFIKILNKLKKLKLIKIESILQEKTQNIQCEKKLRLLSKEINKNLLTKRQQQLITNIKELDDKELVLSDILKRCNTTLKTIKRIEDLGLLEIYEEEIYRDPLKVYNIKDEKIVYELSENQKIVFDKILDKINSSDKKNYKDPILLHGITGSGKTQIYFEIIDKVIKSGRNVLFLVPEIALASQLTKRLCQRFNSKDIAIWHSSVSDGEKYDVFRRLREDKIKILLGARSSIFAPIKNLGLIIIDESHESSYKQSNPAPRYDTIKVAQKLAELSSANIILGSATPDITSYYSAINSGNLFHLDSRYNDVTLPKVVILDMKEELTRTKGGFFSIPLIYAIDKTLQEKKQVILLINRRGFSTSIQCQSCGEIIKCKNCDIPLVYHKDKEILKCHYCDYQEPYPKVCPECGSDILKNYGIGTQKVEDIAKKIFKEAKIARIDSDVLNSKTRYIEILDDFTNGDIDILIGTQMIAKGLDNKNVTLVGVLSADSSFTFPDFRASERGFQLLTQVAGRSGRGSSPGKVYFQTFNPDFFVIQTAKEQNFNQFYQNEISSREDFDYPPFSQLIKLVFSSEEKYKAYKSALIISEKLRELIEKKSLLEYLYILGPTPCLLERVKDNYRFQILIKNKINERGHKFIASFLKKIKLNNETKMIIDVDPIDII